MQRVALYQSVVLVLHEKFAMTGPAPAPAAGLSLSEQADNQLAASVGAALNASPEGAVDQVGTAVEAGLQQILGAVPGEQNTASDQTDAVAEIRRRVHSLVAAFVATRDGEAAGSVTAAKITTRESGVLEIHTLEGDVVKVDFRNSTSVRLGSAEGAGEAVDTLRVRISERTSLQVHGDLSPAELAAIGDLVRKVDTLANEFFAGDVEQAFAAAADLQMDSSQLADYSLRLSMSQKVRVRMAASPAPVVAAGSPSAAAGGVNALPSATPVQPAPANIADSTLPLSESPSAASAALPESSRAATEASSSATVQEVIGTFVAKLRASFAVSTTDMGLGIMAHTKLRLLAAAIKSHPSSTAATPAATSSLTDIAEKTSA